MIPFAVDFFGRSVSRHSHDDLVSIGVDSHDPIRGVFSGFDRYLVALHRGCNREPFALLVPRKRHSRCRIEELRVGVRLSVPNREPRKVPEFGDEKRTDGREQRRKIEEFDPDEI
jgi:hypothetical protein